MCREFMLRKKMGVIRCGSFNPGITLISAIRTWQDRGSVLQNPARTCRPRPARPDCRSPRRRNQYEEGIRKAELHGQCPHERSGSAGDEPVGRAVADQTVQVA